MVQGQQTQIQPFNQTRAERMNAKRGFKVTLPDSGEEVILRKAGIPHLLQFGLLPDSMSPVVAHMVSSSEGQDVAASQEIAASVMLGLSQLEQIKFVTELYDATLIACGVDPKFVREVTDPRSQVSIYDISAADKEFVFDWAQGGNLTELTERFRAVPAQPVGNVDAVPEGNEVRTEASDPPTD